MLQLEFKEDTQLEPIIANYRPKEDNSADSCCFWGGFEELQLQADIDGAIPVHVRLLTSPV